MVEDRSSTVVGGGRVVVRRASLVERGPPVVARHGYAVAGGAPSVENGASTVVRSENATVTPRYQAPIDEFHNHSGNSGGALQSRRALADLWEVRGTGGESREQRRCAFSLRSSPVPHHRRSPP